MYPATSRVRRLLLEANASIKINTSAASTASSGGRVPAEFTTYATRSAAMKALLKVIKSETMGEPIRLRQTR